MKQSLKTLFKQYGRVLDVVAHKSIRMRGQAFVTLDSKDAAVKAVEEVQTFPLYGKPMVSPHSQLCGLMPARSTPPLTARLLRHQHLAFARTQSDALVKARTPDEFDVHKAERLVRKSAVNSLASWRAVDDAR